MKMPIPNDWDGSTLCNFLVSWPDSALWRMILRGLLSNPSLEAFWDERTGDVAATIEAFSATLDQNIDNLECTNMNIPVGTIWLYAGETAPDGWLLCTGDYYLETDFPELFAVVGRLYGGSSGEGTFRLPDLRGRIPVGYDLGQTGFHPLGQTGGEKTHTLTASEMPSHTHTQNGHNHTQNSHNHTQDSHNHTQNAHGHTVFGALDGLSGGGLRTVKATSSSNNATTSSDTATNQAATATNQAATATNQVATATNQNTGGDGAHNNLQPYQVLNYIIRVDP